MLNVLKRPRIVLACSVGILLVLAAIVNTPDSTANSLPDSRLEAVVGKAPERDFIVVSDKDKNGIPDWQESLAEATELPQFDTEQGTTTQGNRTLTSDFSRNFTESLMLAKLYGTYDESQEEIITNAVAQLADETAPKLHTEDDFTSRASSDVTALRAYGNEVAAVTFRHSVGPETRNALTIIDEAGKTDNEAVLNELKPIIAAYQNMEADMLATPVPPALRQEHAALTNAYLMMHEDIAAMGDFFTDPIRSLVHLRRYEQDRQVLIAALKSLYLELHDRGVRFDETDTVSKLLWIEE